MGALFDHCFGFFLISLYSKISLLRESVKKTVLTLSHLPIIWISF
nr:MAG TPA: hypothetical protein [Caudoviricetes sp.]